MMAYGRSPAPTGRILWQAPQAVVTTARFILKATPPAEGRDLTADLVQALFQLAGASGKAPTGNG
jgi:hypothetical protein